MEMRFVPDEAIDNELEDTLEVCDFVDLLRNSIYTTQAPFVYGILGDWGVGKTSVLKILKNRISKEFDTQEGGFIPIWFNAWKYENETNIVYPLLHTVKTDYTNRCKRLDKAREFWHQFTVVATASVTALTDIGLRIATKQLAGEAIKLEEISKQVQLANTGIGELEKTLDQWVDQVDQLHGAFEKLLDLYARDLVWSGAVKTKEEVKFIFLIDDLDRCLPETTISMLESIKNFLAVKNSIFVLGLNPNIIYQGIRVKYNALGIDGREYLEKILNYSFYIPEPRTNKIPEFVIKQFEVLVPDEKIRLKYSKNFLEFGETLEKCRFNNPRKIKRILNRYLFFLGMYELSLEKYHNSNVIRLVILAEYFPSVFQLFLGSDSMTTRVKADLLKLGQEDFAVEEFNKKYGISISQVYPQLSKMVELFNLNLNTANNAKFNVTKHAQDVFCIARII